MSAAQSPIRSLFEPPEDDPLLNDEMRSARSDGNRSATASTPADASSRMSKASPEPSAPCRARQRLSRIKEFVVPLSPCVQTNSVDALNEVLDEEWRLVGMRLTTDDSGMRAIGLTLRRQQPPSLFDFGG